MASMDLRADHRQQQTLSPRLQQAVRLLQLSSLDFAQAVQQALGRNPFLEVDEEDSDDAAGALPDDGPAPGDCSAEPATAAEGDPGLTAESDRDIWADGSAARRGGDDDDLSALDRVAVEFSLAGHLHAQLLGQKLSPRELLLAQIIVDSLDDDGYLRSELDELRTLIDLAPPASAAEMACALAHVQALDPAGVGARSVAECLLLQLPSIGCADARALARRIIEEQLPSLAAHDVAALSRALGRTPAEIEQVRARIRHLDPRPGWRIGPSPAHYVIPDVIVRKRRGAWSVQLNPAIVPKVKLNYLYAEMFRRCKRAQDVELAGQLQEARWMLRNVEQRFSTIVDVAQAIVRRQRHFLDFGAMAMKPLGLREIADELGLHESTVSRVTNNKYMATPLGVFELKYFFSRALPSVGGNACSGTAIRGLVKDMIDAERPGTPLSDAEIARLLARQGLVVARRTVTKYRQLLGIETFERRRRHA